MAIPVNDDTSSGGDARAVVDVLDVNDALPPDAVFVTDDDAGVGVTRPPDDEVRVMFVDDVASAVAGGGVATADAAGTLVVLLNAGRNNDCKSMTPINSYQCI
jgi:hypothetical protein